MHPLSTLGDCFVRERARWVYWLPAALAAGIVGYFALDREPPLWVLTAVPVLGATAWGLRYRSWTASVALFVCAVAAMGFGAAVVETRLAERPMLDDSHGPVPIAGHVAVTEIMPDGARLTLTHPRITGVAADAIPARIRIKFRDMTLDDAPPTGASVKLYGTVGPFSEPVAPGAADFRRQAFFRQLGGLGWSFGKVEIINPEPDTASWRERCALAFENARKKLAHDVYAHLSGDVAAMTATRLNGEQTAISQPVIEAMRIAGLSHLLSTSGFHVTVMALLIYFPLRAMLALIPTLALRYPIKKVAALAAILSALGYSLLVGSQAATLRSLVMTALAMLAIIVDRRATPLRLVMLSAVIGMLIAPDAAMGASFQLSFAAVFCLIVANDAAWEWTTGDFTGFAPAWLRSFGGHMWGIARTSLIATAATTPFAIYHFQSFSLYGFIANMLAIPITSFWVMPAILMAYVTAPFGCDGWLIDAAGAGVAITIRIAKTVAALPHSAFYLPAMPGLALGVIVLGGLWLCIWRESWRWLGLVPIIIGMSYPLYTPQPDFLVAPDGREWAARLDDGRLAVSNLDHDKFAVEQWQQRLGMINAVDVFALSPDNRQVRCDAMGCIYRHGAQVVAMPSVETAALEDCRQATIVIAPFPIADCGAARVIDSDDLAAHGAQAIHFDGDKTSIESARDRRGGRPWSMGWERQ